MSGTWKGLQDWLTVGIGVLLFIAPFVLGATANQAATWTAYAVGVLLAIAGLWSLVRASCAGSSMTRRSRECAASGFHRRLRQRSSITGVLRRRPNLDN